MDDPACRALLNEVDLDCLELDEGIEAHITEWWTLEAPEPETAGWVEAVIAANPGMWMARLCRAMHGLPETEESIRRCGLCREYANPRKRARAKRWAEKETLPGIQPPYQLHARCGRRGFTWLRHRIYRLKHVRRHPGSVIPDRRQSRGWDYGTRVYPGQKET